MWSSKDLICGGRHFPFLSFPIVLSDTGNPPSVPAGAPGWAEVKESSSSKLQGLAGATLTACACSTSGTKKSVWIYPRCLQRCCFFTLLAKSRPNTHSRLTSSTWGENILYFSTVNPTPGGEAGMGKLKPKACMNRGGSDCCWSGIASCQLSVYKLPKRRLRRHGMPHSTSMSKNTHWVLLWWQWECTNNVFRPKTSTRNNKRF